MYMNYFPPPPIFPAPPPYSSRICSSKSFVISPCSLFNDHNHLSLYNFISSIHTDQLTSSPNGSSFPPPTITRTAITTKVTRSLPSSNKRMFTIDNVTNLIQNHFHLLFLLLSILVFLILLLILLIHYQRFRQRHLTSTNKTHQIYYHLIPIRRKARTSMNMIQQTQTRPMRESPMTHIVRLSKTSGTHTKAEEVL
ncbi:unnamed protein product [Adineta ricciae]|uniref:Uncharacterized protein n=1 Tax=Adineta ricciae TaxID=249248 RepID=A0A813ZCD0_ADIRI|nr:unnamed protein product [Adineta ricciae]CAF1400898.1 unnamed protein product [Adineta ricciae]